MKQAMHSKDGMEISTLVDDDAENEKSVFNFLLDKLMAIKEVTKISKEGTIEVQFNSVEAAELFFF